MIGADVTSIEATRSRMGILGDLNSAGFANQVGPGVYNIHSPRVPAQGEIEVAARSTRSRSCGASQGEPGLRV